MQRYNIVAKRRNRDEEFTEWTCADNWDKALYHKGYAEKVGYDAKIEVHSEVKKLWDVLGETNLSKDEIISLTDKILDADFRKASTVKESTARKVFYEVKKVIIEGSEIGGEECTVLKAINELEVKFGVRYGSSV